MRNLGLAIRIAVKAHAGQKDKGGQPYILHPLRVMLAMDTEEERIVAVLHDVVEDSDWTIEHLRTQGFLEIELQLLTALTKERGEKYPAYIQRVGVYPVATKVKLADLADNLDFSRLPTITTRDLERWKKYLAAVAVLTGRGGYDE